MDEVRLVHFIVRTHSAALRNPEGSLQRAPQSAWRQEQTGQEGKGEWGLIPECHTWTLQDRNNTSGQPLR